MYYINDIIINAAYAFIKSSYITAMSFKVLSTYIIKVLLIYYQYIINNIINNIDIDNIIKYILSLYIYIYRENQLSLYI